MTKKTYQTTLRRMLAVLLLCPISCTGLLDEKPDLALVTPTTINELWALLDNTNQVMNAEPSNLDVMSDDILFLDSKVSALSEDQFRLYTWSKEAISTSLDSDWSRPYEQILFANVVLSELENYPEADKQTAEWSNLKGAALFYRSYAYFSLAKSFCPAYNPETADGQLGLVLRDSPEVDRELQRGTLSQTFDLILQDLLSSVDLLAPLPQTNTRPSQAGAYAMLSRVYLYMGAFQESLEYADLALGIQGELLDYNEVDSLLARPMVGHLEEVIFYSELIFRSYYFFSSGSAVNPELTDQYEENDMRKKLFFFPRDGFLAFRGQYSYLANAFGGLAVDEVLLSKAESEARLGRDGAALASLNTLLEKRIAADSYIPLEGVEGGELLELILLERRKELVLRGIRWGDIKRLSVLGEGVVLKRQVGEQEYELPVGDPRYAIQIPQEEIDRSGIQQNPN
jgi:tetratricopeptide (TPR) repeat protein